MRAFLLAGGRGERLRPLTLSVPKCLVMVNGTPLLAIWLDLLARQDVSDVLVNVSHHVEQVRAFLRAWRGGPRVHLVVEPDPVGNAGTVGANRWFVEGADAFWILYADNLTNVRLGRMREAHDRHRGILTIGLFPAPDPRAAGIVAVDATGLVTEFVEKPSAPRGNLANAGIYLARPDVFRYLRRTDGVLDFGHDVFPRLIGQMYGYVIEEFLMDVGTPAALDLAAKAWSELGSGGARP